MKRWIEKARQQPDYKKNMIALSTALSISAIILIVWISTIPARFNESPESVVTVRRESPLSDIKDNLASAFESIGTIWEDLSLKVQSFSNRPE